MGVCTAASSVPNIQDQLNKVLPEFEHTFVFVNNMTKEHLSFRTYIYIYILLYWCGSLVLALRLIKNHNNKTLAYSLGVPKHKSKVLQVMGT